MARVTSARPALKARQYKRATATTPAPHGSTRVTPPAYTSPMPQRSHVTSKDSIESFSVDADREVERTLVRRDGTVSKTRLPLIVGGDSGSADAAFDLAWLRSTARPEVRHPRDVIRTVDLFAGCGGLSVGIAEAARGLGMRMDAVLANDIDEDILGIYSRNFPGAEIVCAPVETLLDGTCGAPVTLSERQFADRLGPVDLVIGGPPCQGHSDFNNHTRNDDPKNELYLTMARFCEVVQPTHVIIENVPGVERDRRRVAQRTWRILEDLGYSVDSGIVDASRLGVAQRRRRSITVASRAVAPNVEEAVGSLEVPERSLAWAITDLLDVPRDLLIDQPPRPNDLTRSRIDYLFNNGLFDLPDAERPDCHRLKPHSYVSVYGRMHWDRPAQTLTTGFGVMGRGRFVHPSQRRTITPHEAARIQFFPDFFDFGEGPRTLIHKVIGNAVPPKMGYALGVHLLR